MAPKRRVPATASSSAPPKPRLSKLAKENNITNEQESEIREAFSLFAVKLEEEFGNEKEGVMKCDDVRRCLIALGITVKKAELPDLLETLDPADTGFVTYGPFLSYAAIHLHHNDDDEREDQSEEVHEAYNLFTANTAGPISLAHLRRVSRILKEDVSDEMLKDMIAEANGQGRDGWRRGVGIEDFEAVLRRAGVFG